MIAALVARYAVPVVAVFLLGAAAGALAMRWAYAPTVAALTGKVASLQADIRLLNDTADRVRAQATKALNDARLETRMREDVIAKLKRDLAGRVYKAEPCDDAAAQARAQWRAR